MLSSMHKDEEVLDREDRKPSIILEYNRTKGAVDTLDQCVHQYSCSRQTRWWTVRMFFNLLDIAAWNAFLCWKLSNPTWNATKNFKRRLFPIELGQALVRPHMARQWESNIRLSVRNRIKAVGLIDTTPVRGNVPEEAATAGVRGRCYLCEVRRLSRTRCSNCKNFV